MKTDRLRAHLLVSVVTLGILSAGHSAAQTNAGVAGAVPEDCQCLGRVGDVNQSGNDEPTIGDLVDLAIYRGFIDEGGTPPFEPCLVEADINQSGGANPTPSDITIGDITTLINYLFIAGSQGATLPTCLEGGVQ